MAGGLQLRSTVSEEVSVPHSDIIGQTPPVPPRPAVDWEAVEREEARLAAEGLSHDVVVQKTQHTQTVAPAGVGRTAPAGVVAGSSPADITFPMDELQIPCADGAFTMRYPRGMSPADVDLVLPLVTAFLRRKRGPRTRKGKA